MCRRRAFTMLELLVIVFLMGLMVTVGVVSVRMGQGAARVKGATRDVFAAIRSARSTALVTQQPAIITYSVEQEDGEPVARIEITSAKLMSAGVDRSKVRTLTGEPLKGVDAPSGPGDGSSSGDGAASEGGAEGETIEEVLFAPIKADVVRGMRLKVVVGSEAIAEETDAPVRKTRISVFSNVDYLLGKFKEAKASSEASRAKESGAEQEKPPEAESQEPVSVVWEETGRVDPHQVWVYADGTRPEDGLLIKVDRFGAAKVVSGDGREE